MNAKYVRVPRGSDEADRSLLVDEETHIPASEQSSLEPKQFRIPVRITSRTIVLICAFVSAVTLTASHARLAPRQWYPDRAVQLASVVHSWMALVVSVFLIGMDLLSQSIGPAVRCSRCSLDVPAALARLRVATKMADALVFALEMVASVIPLVHVSAWYRSSVPAMAVGGSLGIVVAAAHIYFACTSAGSRCVTLHITFNHPSINLNTSVGETAEYAPYRDAATGNIPKSSDPGQLGA